ncbi:hypothetical protein LINPERHAP1_LOCUS7025, partial [Linum perenne]
MHSFLSKKSSRVIAPFVEFADHLRVHHHYAYREVDRLGLSFCLYVCLLILFLQFTVPIRMSSADVSSTFFIFTSTLSQGLNRSVLENDETKHHQTFK